MLFVILLIKGLLCFKLPLRFGRILFVERGVRLDSLQ